MMTRSRTWPRPRLSAGQCRICLWWFDGYQVGAGEPTGNTGPIVEWAVDAKHTGRCLKRECYVTNRFEAPKLETPRAKA